MLLLENRLIRSAFSVARLDAVKLIAGHLAASLTNAKLHAEFRQIADEQAALRRVATLVAQGAEPTDGFDAVAAEMLALLNADGVTLCRYEPGDEFTVLTHLGPLAEHLPPDTRVAHDSVSVSATVRRTGRPARMDSYADTHGRIGDMIEVLRLRAGVGVPIIVDGSLWGVTIAGWTSAELPPRNTEERMAQFTQLLDTAFANADSRDQLMASRARLLVAEDNARRRVVRDLHDGAQQSLVNTIVMLKLAKRGLTGDRERAESMLDRALEQTEKANEELRELAHGILPAVLTRGGLEERVGDVEVFIDAVARVAGGGSALDPEVVGRMLGRRRQRSPLDELSPREHEVLALVAEGKSNHGIAAACVITEAAVEKHIRNIFNKLGLEASPTEHRRVRAAVVYLRDSTRAA